MIRNTYPKGNRSPEQNFITVKIHTYYFCCVLIYASRTLKFQKTWTITDRVQTSPMFLSSNAFEKCPWNVMEINVWKIFKGFINKLNLKNIMMTLSSHYKFNYQAKHGLKHLKSTEYSVLDWLTSLPYAQYVTVIISNVCKVNIICTYQNWQFCLSEVRKRLQIPLCRSERSPRNLLRVLSEDLPMWV